MRNFRKLGSALTFSMIIGLGMTAFSTPVHAFGPGNGQSTGAICTLLETSYNLLPQTEDYAALAEKIKSYAQSLGCAWAQ